MEKSDSDLFRESIKIDKKLDHNLVKPARKSLPVIARQRLEDERLVIEEMFSAEYEPADVETGEELLFFRPGVSSSIFRKLRRGKLSIESELDLHGLRVVEAKTRLAQYLLRCQKQGKRCVRIIHGKGKSSVNGQPVIKKKVNLWLRQRDEILAFCTARHVDGGTGALYVLLRKSK